MGEANPGKFNFGVGTGGNGDEYSGDGFLEVAQSLFGMVVESPSYISVVGVTRGKKVLFINNSPNSELADSGDTGLLLEKILL